MSQSRHANAYTRHVTLVNREGLHARPASQLVTLAKSFPVPITINGTDATSLLGIMSLGLLRGADVTLCAAGNGIDAVDALASLIQSGFGEATQR